MNTLRIFLVAIWLLIAGYTALVVTSHGLNLLRIFFAEMTHLDWPGQLSLPGPTLGLLAAFGGAFFLSTYLLIASYQVNGESKALLPGEARAAN